MGAADQPDGADSRSRSETVPSAAVPETPAWVGPAARTLFGPHLPQAERYARLLVTGGVVRGLIGPREADRIWQRHLLNCAAVTELIPPRATVSDVGAGAGLPGIVLAVARPDLTVTLVEPLARRTTFLAEVVRELRLTGRVRVVRARAEECADRLPTADVVTARALAALDRLAGWCLPLASIGGRVLALKGATAADEVAAHAAAVGRLGGGAPVVRRCGVAVVEPPATVVEIVRERAGPAGGAGARPTRPGPARAYRSRRGGRANR